ncbi:MAG: hypothetical protein QW717_00500 [Candidatus Bathyarchaeia archaeon]
MQNDEKSREIKNVSSILQLFDDKNFAFLGGVFNSKAAKILYCLYCLLPYNRIVRYKDIAEFTKMDPGNQLYYPLQNLQRLGLLKRIEFDKNTIGYSLTDAGYLTAELLHSMIKDLIKNADLLPPEARETVTSIDSAMKEVESSLREMPVLVDRKDKIIYLRKRY